MNLNNLFHKIKPFTTLTIIALTTFTSVESFAGDRVGNGGDVVVCKDFFGRTESVELLDLFESKILKRKFNYITNTHSKRYYQIVQQRLKYLDRFVKSDKIKQLHEITDLISANTYEFDRLNERDRKGNVLFTEDDLVDIDDSLHSFLPRNCKVEQIAIRISNPILGDPEYIINKGLWRQLDELNKAALIIHEAVYKVMQAKDSRKVRYFTQALFLDDFKDISYPDFLKIFSVLDGNSTLVLDNSSSAKVTLDMKLCDIIDILRDYRRSTSPKFYIEQEGRRKYKVFKATDKNEVGYLILDIDGYYIYQKRNV